MSASVASKFKICPLGSVTCAFKCVPRHGADSAPLAQFTRKSLRGPTRTPLLVHVPSSEGARVELPRRSGILVANTLLPLETPIYASDADTRCISY